MSCSSSRDMDASSLRIIWLGRWMHFTEMYMPAESFWVFLQHAFHIIPCFKVHSALFSELNAKPLYCIVSATLYFPLVPLVKRYNTKSLTTWWNRFPCCTVGLYLTILIWIPCLLQLHFPPKKIPFQVKFNSVSREWVIRYNVRTQPRITGIYHIFSTRCYRSWSSPTV
jgi:hypothetical protein